MVLFAEYLLFYHLAHIIILLFSVFTEEKSKQISTHVKRIIRQGCSCFSISNEFFQKDPNSLDTPQKQLASKFPENLSKIVRFKKIAQGQTVERWYKFIIKKDRCTIY